MKILINKIIAMFFFILLFELILAAILFGGAGRFDLPWFWALLSVHTILMCIGAALIDPDLLRERRRNIAGIDRRLRVALSVAILIHLLVAALDARFGWSKPLPGAWRGASLLIYVAGVGFSLWAMRVNPFFSRCVRIQEERGHRVISDGPYRWLRHPGYFGMCIALVAEGPVLGSWWAFFCALVALAVIFQRTHLEDSMLSNVSSA